MSGEIIERRTVKSWHGLEFEIVVWSNWRAKIGFMIHPQVANFMMRHGLPESVRGKMEVLHEFGHVQTFPFVLIYYLPFLLFSSISDIYEFIVVTAGMLLFWEVLAEMYVFARFEGYLSVYRKHASTLTLIYWIALSMLLIFPFILVL